MGITARLMVGRSVGLYVYMYEYATKSMVVCVALS